MSDSASVLTDTTFLSVNVHAHGSAFACKVHAKTRIDSLTAQIHRQLQSLPAGEETTEYLASVGVTWGLEHGPLRRRLDPHTTLDQAGVRPGDDLYLTKRRRTEEFPILRDDIADSTAEVSKRQFAVLGATDTRRLSVAALPLTVLAACGVGMASVLAGDTGLRWPVFGVLAALALMCASASVTLARTRDDFADASAALCAGAYLATASAAAVGVPRGIGVWHLTSAGAAVATVAVIMWSLTGGKPTAMHIAALSVSGSAVLVGAAHLAFGLSSQAVACAMLFVTVASLVWATQSARAVGGLRVNYIPTTGEPLVRREDMTVAQVSRRSTSAAAIEALRNKDTNVVSTVSALIGLAWACGAAMTCAAFAAGLFTGSYEWHTFALAACCSVALVAVGRGLVIRAAAIPLVVAGPLTWTAYLLGRALSHTPAEPMVLAAGALPLVIIVLVAALRGLRSVSMHSPVNKRRLELVAVLAVVAVFPLLVFIAGGWSAVRGR